METWDLSTVTTKAGRNKLALRVVGGPHLCDISVYDEKDWDRVRMMRAAPELLEACKKALAQLRAPTFAEERAVISELSAAIAKAGEAL